MKSPFKNLVARRRERIRSRQFLEAAMGASALVAAADGEVSFAELLGRDHVLNRVEKLQVFESEDAVAVFGAVVEELRQDPDEGARRVFEAVARFAGDKELAQLLLRICVAIAKADTDFSDSELRVVADLCQALGVQDIEIDSLPGSD